MWILLAGELWSEWRCSASEPLPSSPRWWWWWEWSGLLAVERSQRPLLPGTCGEDLSSSTGKVGLDGDDGEVAWGGELASSK